MSTSISKNSFTPLELPEILSHVATFINDESSPLCDLASCSLVSTSFYYVFAPLLYQTINFRKGPSYPPSFLKTLERHGKLVRTLEADFLQSGPDTEDTLTIYALPYFRNLHTLRIFQSLSSNNFSCNTNPIFLKKHWTDLATLVEQNLGLRDVYVEVLGPSLIPARFWKAVAGLPYLWTLTVNGALISNAVDTDNQDIDSDPQKPVVEAFMEACRSARVLDFDLTTFITQSQLQKSGLSPFEDQFSLWNSPSLVFNNITSISYFGRNQLDLAFFSHCLAGASHTLKRIKWSTKYLFRYTPSMMAKEVTQVIIETTQKSRPRGLSVLESLELWDGEYFTDQEIADILDALPNPLQELSVRESGFGEKAMEALFREPGREFESQRNSEEILYLEEFEKISIQDVERKMAKRNDNRYSVSSFASSTSSFSASSSDGKGSAGFSKRVVSHANALRKLDLTDCVDLQRDLVDRITLACPNLESPIWDIS